MDGTARSALGLTKVFAPNSKGDMVECNERCDIEPGCLEENEKRFTQSKTTPLMVSPLVDDFGYLGVTPAAHQVTAGKYVVEESLDDGI